MNPMITEEAADPFSTTAQPTGRAHQYPTAPPAEGEQFSFDFYDTVIEISPCDAEGHSEVVAVERESFPDYIAFDAAFLKEEISGGKYFVARDRQGLLAGYFGLDFEDDHIYLSNIVVTRPFNRRGLCKRLLDYIMRLARQRGYNHITLHVSVFNYKAVNLYHCYGFEVTGIERHFYRDEEDAFFMEYFC